MNRRPLLLLLPALALAGCASAPTPTDYAAETPTLDLKAYFNGPLTAHGLVTDRGGKVTRRFVVELQGRWQGDVGTLEEDFRYSDGTTERRVWNITHHGSGRYTGTAGDVIGEAQGEARGNALRWQYTLRVPVGNTTYDVQFDDWMFQMDGHVLLNRARMSKFGFHVGDVTVSFSKP